MLEVVAICLFLWFVNYLYGKDLFFKRIIFMEAKSSYLIRLITQQFLF
jgi:hypothetical protein